MKVFRRVNGFSLIELVSVILLLGIVATVVLPRFSSRDGFAEYAVRDQFIAAFRFAQQRAMYDHGGSCYSVIVDDTGFSPRKDLANLGNFEKVDFEAGEFSGLRIDLAPGPDSDFIIYFDGLGNINTTSCGSPTMVGSLSLTVSPGAVAIEIYSTGFIQ